MAPLTRVIALVDLDDTLFQTIGKCPSEIPADRLTPLGFTREGRALSFATPRQMSFLNWLAETTHMVPVTARSLEALRRARLPYAAAVCAHGGVILGDDGRVDAGWAAVIADEAAVHSGALEDFAEAISLTARRFATPVNVRVLTEESVRLYVLAKHADGDAVALHRVVDAAVAHLPSGWTDHRNGNNIALMPPYLGKQHAVAHLLPDLRARFPDAAVVGIGDSLTDAPFMALCDYAMMPTGSQIARLIDA